MTNGFEKTYKRFCGGRKVSKGLRPLLEEIFCTLHVGPTNLARIKKSLISLFSFLCEQKNRTEANCWAVDLFFLEHDHWNVSWDSFPPEYEQLLDDIGGCLHDAISAPEIASNFESTPEQLLLRAKELKEWT